MKRPLYRSIPGALVALFFLALLAGLSCSGPDERDAEAAMPPTVRTKGGVEMVLIPAGSFQMGRRQGAANEKPVHTVSIDAFLMDKYEVTQAEFDRLELPNPSHFKGSRLPVEMVSWTQAAVYCNARSRAEGLRLCYNEASAACDFRADGYRLPTEAEWEYACRAGTAGDYYCGDGRRLGEHAWFADNAGRKTHPVGHKKPNPWGLYDMYGNVAEWCNDAYDKNYYQKSPAQNPRGPAGGRKYVLRGGAWDSKADSLRSSHRVGETPGFQDACFARDAIGFRCVRKAPAKRLK
jgi:formylglycine-generating enzyme required for sulfatase activity